MDSFVRYLVYFIVTLTLTCVKVGAFRVQQLDTSQVTEDVDTYGVIALAVSASGVKEDGSLTVAVQLASHTTHTLEPLWTIDRKGGYMQQIEGRLEEDHWFAVDVSNASSVERVLFQIYVDDNIVGFDFSEFENETYYSIPRPEFSLQLDKTYTVHEGHDLEIDVVVNGNYSQVDTYLTVYPVGFYYVNTSLEPPQMTSTLLKKSDQTGIRLKSLAVESTKVCITLKHKYAKFGGYMTVDNMQIVGSHAPGYLMSNKVIKILSPGLNAVVPANNVGIYQFSNSIMLSNEHPRCISCCAMGNPKPEVSILKLQGDGAIVAVPDVINFLSTEATVSSGLNLRSSDPEAEGLYICRAKAGTATTERRIEVYRFKLAVFDDSLTGVMRNGANGVFISCQASGKPRPRLEIHASDPYGPDLTDQVSMTLIDDITERVTLIISPSNPINTVYCKAQQENNRGDDNVRKIDVYLDPGWNWDDNF